MSQNLLNLVEEFRRSPEIQHRKNAVTALAVIPAEEATTTLVEVALTDVDRGVRERADQEILSLGPTVQERVIEIAIRGLEKTQKRQAAYVLLGRLRSNGCDIPFSRTPLLTWVRLSLGLNLHLYPARNWRFRTRAWKYGLLGGLAAITFMVMIFLRSWQLKDYRGMTAISIAIAFLSPVVAILATQRTSPIGLYVHRLLGFLTETLSTLIFASLFLVALLIVYFILRGGYVGPDSDMIFILIMPLIFGVFVAIVRFGTILGYGRLENRRWNWAAQVVMGIATGTLVLTIANFVGWEDRSNYGLNSALGGMWLILFPASFITANAFAAIDNEISPIRPIIGRIGTAICILILIPFLALTILVLRFGRDAYINHSRGPTLNHVFNKITGKPEPTPVYPWDE